MILITLVANNQFALASDKLVIAVAEIKLGNPTAELVFKSHAVRDILTKELHDANTFEVIDWSRLSAVLFRRNMAWSDVIEDDKERQAIKDVLLNDYFLTGSISHYSESIDYQSGTFSDTKTQVANIQLDLFIKDAVTNKIIVSSRSTVEKRREVKQSLGFGSSANTSTALAQNVLNDVVKKSVNDLVMQMKGK